MTDHESSGPCGPATVFSWTGLMTLSTVAIAAGHPYSYSGLGDTWFSAAAKLGWITMEASCLLIPVLIIALLGYRWRPNVGFWGGVLMAGMVPAIFLADCLVFHWTGQRFLSRDVAHVISNLLPGLLGYVSLSTAAAWGVSLVAFALILRMLFYLASRLGAVLSRHYHETRVPSDVFQPVRWIACWFVCAGLASVPQLTMWHSGGIQRQLLADSARHSTRHPWVAFGFLRLSSAIGIGAEQQGRDSVNVSATPDMETYQSLELTVQRRLQQNRLNVVIHEDEDLGERPPDVLLIILESLRNDCFEPDVMPNVATLATQGMQLKNHFSGGNASSLGVFSIVNGLEAVWFHKSDIRYAPAMNRLFRQAGYELGFFAGHTDWATFQMDAFLSERHFDRFETHPMSWLASDRHAIRQTESFLQPDAERSARLAVLFLYSTHAPFAVDPRFASDQPTIGEGYPIPFPPMLRQRVFNRYRNAARTLDAELAGLLSQPDRLSKDLVILATGDHGESFGDDGTIGHGTRLSHVQNSTPALIAGASFKPSVVTELTTHADLLPTLLAACGIRVSQPNQFDGVDLLHCEDQRLRNRVVSSAHYLRKEAMLLGHWTTQPNSPLGYVVEVSLMDGSFQPSHAIDDQGNRWESRSELSGMRQAARSWLRDFGAITETTTKPSSSLQ